MYTRITDMCPQPAASKERRSVFEIASVENAYMSNPAINKQSQTQKSKLAEREKEFREAVELVYRKYGNNLFAFLRDVNKQKEVIKRG